MSQLWSGHDWSGNYLFFLVVLGFYWLVPWPRCVYPSSSFRPACVYVCVSVWVCMCVHVCPWRADELSCWALSILALSLLSPPPPPRPILCFFLFLISRAELRWIGFPHYLLSHPPTPPSLFVVNIVDVSFYLLFIFYSPTPPLSLSSWSLTITQFRLIEFSSFVRFFCCCWSMGRRGGRLDRDFFFR